MDSKSLLDDLVSVLMKEDGSDLHIAENRYPVIRVSGFLLPLVKKDMLSKEGVLGILDDMLTEENKKLFQENKEVDFSFTFKEKARFRGNAYYRQGEISIALRLIPKKIRTLSDLKLPKALEDFSRRQQGFFLVVGPVGHGKTTTLASMIEIINQDRAEHIITIEDPIEYIFEPKKSIIDQREIRTDTKDFHTGLNAMFREDVDVAMIGEMRGKETISTAVTAAQTIDRIIDSFQADQQDQIRLQLAGSLIGIFSQRLIPRVSGGLVPAFELLIANAAVSNLIREGRTHEISTVIETGMDQGMIDINRSLVDLVRQGEITVENAYQYSMNPKSLEKFL